MPLRAAVFVRLLLPDPIATFDVLSQLPESSRSSFHSTHVARPLYGLTIGKY